MWSGTDEINIGRERPGKANVRDYARPFLASSAWNLPSGSPWIPSDTAILTISVPGILTEITLGREKTLHEL